MTTPLSYKDAGVDIDAGDALIERIKPFAKKTMREGVLAGIGGFGAIADAVRTTETRGPQRLSPFTVPSFLVNLAAGQVSIRHGLKGPLGAPVTACAARHSPLPNWST